MTKYLLAVLATFLVVGLVYFHVHYTAPAPVVTAPVYHQPEPSVPNFSGPPVVPVEPEPAPAPAKPAHKHCHRHYKVIYHGYYFHGQWCAHKWVRLPGSVKCLDSGQQFLPDELEWSIPK